MSIGVAKRQLMNPANIGNSSSSSSSSGVQSLTYGCRYSGNGTSATSLVASNSAAPSSSGSFANTRVGNTSLDAPLLQSGMSAVASISVGGIALDSDSIQSGIVRNILKKFSARIAINQLTNSRYWIGLINSGNGPVGNATGLANDNPNFPIAAFRCSAGDVNWKAYLSNSSIAFTVVDTGVAAAIGSSHLFEIAFDITTNNFQFFIDSIQVAAFNTNSPTAATLLNGVATADNKNTANVATLNFGWMEIAFL